MIRCSLWNTTVTVLNCYTQRQGEAEDKMMNKNQGKLDRMGSRCYVFLLVALLLFSLTGCGTNRNERTTAVSIEKVTEENMKEVEESTYPMTVTDQAGRQVVIEKEPESLISCYYITSSLLIALDLDERMVGIETKPEKRPIYLLASEQLLDLPTVGSAKELDLEACAALNPDLAILPLKLKDAAASLEELGITTLLVNPESEQLLLEMIDLVSMVSGVTDKGQELKEFITARESDLVELFQNTEKKRVYLSGNSSFFSTAGNQMYQSDMITLAGGENVAKDIEDSYWVTVDYEQILAWDPEVIILAANAEYTVEEVLADENLASCTAIQNGDVYKIPSDVEAWDSPVPGGILGSVWLANVLHPEVITSQERDRIIKEFYETFYEISE